MITLAAALVSAGERESFPCIPHVPHFHRIVFPADIRFVIIKMGMV